MSGASWCSCYRVEAIAAARTGPIALSRWTEAVGKSRGGVSLVPDLVGGANVVAMAPPRVSGRDGSEAVVVELQQVVRRRDEPPFASAGRPASALEASDRAVELDL